MNDGPDPAALAADVAFPTLTADDLTETWRQLHYAAQALSEVGKLWSTPRADDSHTTMQWDEREEALTSEGSGLRGFLHLDSLALRLVGPTGVERRRDLAGATLEEALAWVRDEGTALVGAPRQESVPAPDLPEHSLATGGSFELAPTPAAELSRLYGATSTCLAKLQAAWPGVSSPECWPHHFDLAILAAIATGNDGAAYRTVGAGITPPDGLESSGYWYVSPWSSDDAIPADAAWPALDHGHWLERGGGPRMATLPVATVAALPPDEQGRAVAGFLVHAFTACHALLAP